MVVFSEKVVGIHLTLNSGDREFEIFELLSVAKDLGVKFIVRICAERITNNGLPWWLK